MSDSVVAGQVWQASDGSCLVVYNLTAPEDSEHVYAHYILFDLNGELVGHRDMTCDKLRHSDVTLLYDATLTMPWRI